MTFHKIFSHSEESLLSANALSKATLTFDLKRVKIATHVIIRR